MGDAAEHSASGGGAGARSWRCRCVLLVPSGMDRPERLLRGLRERGAEVAVVRDAPAAMVELAGGARVLIVHEPRMIRRCDELLDAVRQCFPYSRCWRSQNVNGHGSVNLARFMDPVSAAPRYLPRAGARNAGTSPAAATSSIRVPDTRPALPGHAAPMVANSSMQPIDEPSVRPTQPAPPQSTPTKVSARDDDHWRDGSPILTAEELAMLLGSGDAGAGDDNVPVDDDERDRPETD